MNLTNRTQQHKPRRKFGRPNECSSGDDPHCWNFAVGGQAYYFGVRDYSTINVIPTTEPPAPIVNNSNPQTSIPTAVIKIDTPTITQVLNNLPGKTDAVAETNALADYVKEHPLLVAAVALGLGYAVLK